jgi:hypothetical protein
MTYRPHDWLAPKTTIVKCLRIRRRIPLHLSASMRLSANIAIRANVPRLVTRSNCPSVTNRPKITNNINEVDYRCYETLSSPTTRAGGKRLQPPPAFTRNFLSTCFQLKGYLSA